MLKGFIKSVNEYSEAEISAMYSLMAEFYDNTDEAVFRRDFFDKDYCLALYLENGLLVGFTTQKILEIDANGKKVNGIFSGDTIIHKDYWGDTALFKVWAKFWFEFAEKYDEFYWFLICKGYKTYRIMPLFWKEFYPNYRMETPEYEQNIINAYASTLYPDEYNPETGVIEYKSIKDKLKNGVANVGEREIKNKDIAFFCKANPDYINGNDLTCIAKIDKEKLKRRAPELLFS
ncbi:MAG: hypothetical protein UHK60_07675 [Acutalibacteraceae bacterium]|nr:hypothetical protein [Acutalibacteraceae bacterium]